MVGYEIWDAHSGETLKVGVDELETALYGLAHEEMDRLSEYVHKAAQRALVQGKAQVDMHITLRVGLTDGE